MTNIERDAKKALRLKDLALPASPAVVDIDVESDVDTTGDDALRVYVILRDDIEDKSLHGENVLELKRAIRNRLVHEGIHLFPYVFLRTESERREELQSEREGVDA